MRTERRIRIANIIFFLFTGYILGGCASGPNILSDYDHNAPFGTYKTYNFMEDAGPQGSNYQGFFSQYMVAAITIEMEKRGYVWSDDPDLLVNFNAVLQDKTKVTRTSAPPPMGGYLRV